MFLSALGAFVVLQLYYFLAGLTMNPTVKGN